MDSLPTGSTQSWLIVAAVAFSPVIFLFLADAIGWLIRQAKGKGGVTTVGQDASGIRQMSSARTGAVGTVIGAFVPLSPVVAFLIVIAARVERDGVAPAGLPGGASGEGEGANRRAARPPS